MTTKTLENVELLHIKLRIWTGSKTLSPKDLGFAANQLPDDDVVSLGIKRIVDPNNLKPLMNLRQKLKKICHRHGTQFMGGWAIPDLSVPIMKQEVADILDQFDQEVKKFLASYDAEVKAWVQKHPNFAQQLKEAALTKQEVANKFAHSHFFCRVSSSNHDTESIEQSKSFLLGSLISDTVESLKSYRERFAEDPNGQLPARSAKTIGSVADKLKRFASIDPTGSLGKFADQLQAVVMGDGAITGILYQRVGEVLKKTKDEGTLARHLKSLENASSPMGWENPVAQQPQEISQNSHEDATPQADQAIPKSIEDQIEKSLSSMADEEGSEGQPQQEKVVPQQPDQNQDQGMSFDQSFDAEPDQPSSESSSPKEDDQDDVDLDVDDDQDVSVPEIPAHVASQPSKTRPSISSMNW